jgi:hypothetical protein
MYIGSHPSAQVVISGPFIKILLHNHSINVKKEFSFSGDVNYEANFSFFILLHKRAKPIHPLGCLKSKCFLRSFRACSTHHRL